MYKNVNKILIQCLFLIKVTVLASQTYNDSTFEVLPVKVVVVTMFELGEDMGDRPGEFQNWVSRFPLNDTILFPLGYRNLRYNKDKQVLGVVTGIGTARAAATIMALGSDPRFDFSKAYWVVAGISGVDPLDASVGSAIWAEWIVDGDLAHEIDARETPKEWETGYIPLRKSQPFELPRQKDNEGVVYHLNGELVDWAYSLTKDLALEDNDVLAKFRGLYSGFPNAQRPPKVLKGAQLAAMTYWHGALMNDWANKWVDYWSNGQANFMTSAMEETGTLQSLTFLSNAGEVDFDRVLVLRTASNYTMQYEGITAAESLSGEKLAAGGYTAFIPSLEAAYVVGSKVVNELINNWDVYKDKY
ncbi:MAG: hypothetical protein ACFB0A_07370 [Croceivirga sp.]